MRFRLILECVTIALILFTLIQLWSPVSFAQGPAARTQRKARLLRAPLQLSLPKGLWRRAPVSLLHDRKDPPQPRLRKARTLCVPPGSS